MAFDWAAVAQAGGSLIGSILNHFDQKELTRLQNNNARDQLALGRQQLAFNKDVAARNFDMQNTQFLYQKQLNQLMMDREDNAMQRRVSDLQKAGLSPLMATDGAQAGQLLSGSAPQFDPSGINQAYGNLQSAKNDYAQRQLATAQFKLQSKLQIAQLSADLMGALQQYQKNKLDYEYQKGLNDYVSLHGYRNLNWQSELIHLLSGLVGKTNLSSVGDKINEGLTAGKPQFDNVITDLTELLNKPKTIGNSTLKPVTLRQLREDSSKVSKGMDKDYDSAIKDLKTKNPSDSSINYIWKHTEAWRDFEKFEDFKKWLFTGNNKNDVVLGKKYPQHKSRDILTY